MKRENLYKIVFALFALLLVAACDKEELVDTPADGEPQPIRFDIAVATATPSGPSTRVSTATDFTSSFTAGDQVGLYIVKGNGDLQSSGNWVENALMTFDGKSWTCHLPADKKCYPKDGSKLSFYAYYPYNAQVTNPLAMSFSVQADQRAGLSPSYLMTASRKGVPKSHNPVQLTFSHKLAMVKVNLKDGVAAKDKAPFPADVVTLKGRQLTTSLNLATDVVGTSGDATDVKMYYNEADKCWYALVPQQVVTIDSGQLTFEWTHILTLKHTPPKQFTLAMAEVKPLDITINVNMTVNANHVYKVGDAYPYGGFYDKEGVVFEVSNGGKSGKIISLQRWPKIEWSTETGVVYANNEYNGRVNMAAVMTHDATFTKYPAFSKVHGLNPPKTTYTAESKGIWYLPADNELSSIYKEGNQEKIARTLEALGLETPFPRQTFAWSSTEIYSQTWEKFYVSVFLLLHGGLTSFQKTEKHDNQFVWPIMAF